MSAEPTGQPGQNVATDEGTPRRLVALPVQFIETAGGVILKRGCVEFIVSGDRAVETIQVVFEAMANGGATTEEICEQFAAPDRPAVARLIEEIETRQIVVPAGAEMVAPETESHLDVFYWHFGQSTAEINRRLNTVRVAIVGINHVSRQLAGSLAATGMTNFEIIDDELHRNLSLFDEAGKLRASEWRVAAEPVACDKWTGRSDANTFDCLVATSDFGGLQSMRRWNALCLRHNRHFLPVVLQDLIGYVGPTVIPGETACFECFLARLNSNRPDGAMESRSENIEFSGQQVAAFHPSMASVLGDIAAIELTRFYSRALPLFKVGSVMEVNLLAGRIDSRKVLRVPRCRACGPLTQRSSTSTLKDSPASDEFEE